MPPPVDRARAGMNAPSAAAWVASTAPSDSSRPKTGAGPPAAVRSHTPTRASAKPASRIVPGGPWSCIPTSTGTTAPTTPEIGAATGIEFLPGRRMVAAAEPVRRGGGAAAVVKPGR